MFPTARFLALFVFAIAALHADDSLAHARRAQLLLGGDTWSRLLRIENRAAASAYPPVVHALVFELAGLLWFYTDRDGTQSFSLHRDRLAEEKADFAPLLREIEPGFVAWREVSRAAAEAALAGAAAEALPNGCFIESVAALRRRVLFGTATRNPRLLSYYVETAQARQGHTVLAYDTREGVEIVDAARPERVFVFARELRGDALALARALDGPDVVKARTLALSGVRAPAFATLETGQCFRPRAEPRG